MQNEKPRVVLIDTPNMVYSAYFVSIAGTSASPQAELLHHGVWNTLLHILKMTKPNKIVFALDSPPTWRDGIYQHYKANRHISDASVAVKHFISTTLCNFDLVLPCQIVGVPSAEADDVIAIGVQHFDANEYDVVIASSDKDMIQLLTYPHVSVWSLCKHRYITHDDPFRYLQEQILQGDRGDNIPPFAPLVGPKTAQRMCDNTDLLKAKLASDVKFPENLERNEKLIDLSKIPMSLSAKIATAYEAPTRDPNQKLINYFMHYNLTDMLPRTDEFEIVFQRLL